MTILKIKNPKKPNSKKEHLTNDNSDKDKSEKGHF